MKAKVKESGEVFVVYGVVNKTCDGYAIGEVELFVDDHDSFLYDMTPAYWEKLRHQYAGMAMQTMLATLYNPKYHKELMACYTEVDAEEVARLSKYYAHALVEKVKKEERK